MTKFKSKADAIVAYEAKSKEASLLWFCLNDMVAGKVEWFKRGAIKVGYSRLDSASGGYVITDEGCGVRAQYADEFFSDMKRWVAPSLSNDKDYAVWLFMQECARKIEGKRASLYAPAPAMAPTTVDVSTITEYGMTQKLSNQVRVF